MRKTIYSIAVAAICSASATTMQAQTLADAKQMYDYGRFESAKKMATPLAATNAEANYYLGLSYLGLGNVADAKTTFTKYPMDVMNMSGTARVLFAEKKNTEAMAILTGIVAKAKKKDWQSLKYAADAITYSNGVNPAKAIEWYAKAVEINQNGETYMALGDAYMNIADGSGGGNAETNYLYALDYKANASQIAFRRGNLWFSAREYDSAIVNYKRTSELDPNNPLPYNNFANSYYKTNRFELAKKNMESYLKLSDNTADDYFQYINILYLCKDYSGAIAKIDEMSKKGIEKPYMYRLSAISNYELGNNELALKDMDKFFAKSEKAKIQSVDYKYYGKILAKTAGREAEANEYTLKAIDADTSADKSDMYRSVAEDLKSKKDYIGAAGWYAKLIEKTPADKVSVNDYLYNGFCLYAAKNYPSAITAFTTMTQKYPTEPSGFYYLGASNSYKDGNAKSGSGLEAYKKYTEIIGMDVAKKDNLTKAFTYIIEYYNLKKDGVNATIYANKLLEVDATNTYAKQIVDYFKSGKPAPTTKTEGTKTPPKKK
jgi:tetratricopeptide (TPR) repeat protein